LRKGTSGDYLNEGFSRFLPGVWLIVAVFFMAGVYFGPWALIGIVLFFSFFYKRPSFAFLLSHVVFIVGFCLIGIFLGRYARVGFSDLPEKAFFAVSGRVVEVLPNRPNTMVLLSDAVLFDGSKSRLRRCLKVYRRGSWPLNLVGERVVLNVVKGRGRGVFYRGDFIVAYRDWFSNMFVFMSRVRHFLYRKAHTVLHDKAASLLTVLFTGIKDKEYFDYRRDFYDLGVGHILAISGLHIAMLMGVVYLFLYMLPISYRVKHIILALACVFYMLLAGWWSMSLLRAGVMFLLWCVSRIFYRNVSLYDLLALAILLIGMYDVNALFAVGFQLSVASVLSIALSVNLLRRLYVNGILTMFAVSVSAFIGVLGLVVLYFHRVAWFSPFANVVFVPILFLLLVCGFLFVVSGGFVSLPFKWVSWLVFKLSSLAKAVSISSFYVEANYNLVVFLYYVILAGVVFLFMSFSKGDLDEVIDNRFHSNR